MDSPLRPVSRRSLGAAVSSGSRGDHPSPWIAWAAVAVFSLAQIVSTIDRGMLALVIDPIRRDLSISDVQIALLQGLAFAIFYVTIGLPLGAVSDLVNRRKLLIVGIILWSLATASCAFVQNFGQMFASRLMVGLGEAVLAPCAVTMIGDLFPPSRRGAPMAVYVLGSMVAVGLGSLVTGAILDAAPTGVFDIIPGLRTMAPWRIAFLLVGGFGSVIVLCLLPLKEPRRIGVVLEPREGLGIRQAAAYFRDHWKVFLPFYGAIACFGLGTSVAVSWGAALLTRQFHLTPGQAGKALGGDQLASALIGALLAFVLVDRVVRRAGARGKIELAILIPLVAIPSASAWLAHGAGLAVAMIAEVMFVGALFGSTMLSTTTELVPSGMKGVSVALYAFVVTMIGGALSPLAVAHLTQNVFGDPMMVGRSMAIVGVSTLVASSLLAMVSRRQFDREMAQGGAFTQVVFSNAR